jgi:hypothetical protein
MIQLNRDDSLFGGLVVSFAVVGSFLVSTVWTPPAVPDPAPPQNVAMRFAVAAPAPAPAGTTARQSVKAPAPASDALPPLAVSALPTTPPPGPDDPDAPVNPFPVKPYGNTVVVAFKINSDGVILDSRILVPSWNALGDMSIRLAAASNEAKSIRYTNINPPLQPGETRWIVLPHDWKNPGENSLP